MAAPPVGSSDLAPYLVSGDSDPCAKAESSVVTTRVLHDFLEWLESDAFVAYLNERGIGSSGSGSGGSSSIGIPSGVTATSDRTTDVRVQWSGVATATSYLVYRGTSSDTAAMSIISTQSGTTFDDVSAATTPGKVYFYAVKASNAAFISGFSAVASGSVKAGVGVTPIDYSNTSPKMVTIADGVTVMNLEMWGAGGPGGCVPPSWAGIDPTGAKRGGGGGASGSYHKVTGISVAAGDVFYLVPGSSGLASVVYKGSVGSSDNATATPGGPGANGGALGGAGGKAASSYGENNLGTGSSHGSSAVGNDGGSGASNEGGAGGEAIEADAKSAGAGADGNTSQTPTAGSKGRIIVTFA